MDLVTVSRLQRNPTVKTEIQMRNFETSIPVGFFTYPISQAADITAFKATHVPVGEDQEPMIEQTREIVRKFNFTYSDVLIEPNIMLPDNEACKRLPGTDGKAKMSKSLGNCIYLSDSAEEVKAKVMSMYTDPDHIKLSDPGKINAVLEEELEPIRARRKEFEKDIPAVYDILKKGSEKAERVAAATLSEVKSAMKINYFDDVELIKEQSERFK